MKRKNKSIINIAVYLLTLFINFLVGRGYINGMSQAAVSDKYFTSVTPAGFTFIIWGVIYILVLASLVTIYMNPDERYNAYFIDRLSNLFILSCALNILWIIAFSYEKIILSFILILLLMLVLLFILHKSRRFPKSENILHKISFGIYSGWLFIATFANAAILFVYFGIDNLMLPGRLFSFIFLTIALILSVYIYKYHENKFFYLSIIWAVIGITAESKFYLLILVLLIYIAALYYMFKNNGFNNMKKLMSKEG